jgi:hypothetical protein
MSLSRPTTYELTETSDNTSVNGIEKAVQTRWGIVAPASESDRLLTVYNAGPGTVVLDLGASAPKGFMVELVPKAYWESPAPTIEPLQARSTVGNTRIYVREFV